jgi:hypothetical protein
MKAESEDLLVKEGVMALFEEITESVFPGAAIGIGAALLAPVIVPTVGGVLRPVVKTAVKTGLYVTDKLYELAAEAGEQLSDIVAEARSEMQPMAAEGTEAPRAAKRRTRAK